MNNLVYVCTSTENGEPARVTVHFSTSDMSEEDARELVKDAAETQVRQLGGDDLYHVYCSPVGRSNRFEVRMSSIVIAVWELHIVEKI